MLRKRPIMFAESFTMFSFDCNSNNSTLESSLNEESNDSSDDFSANELSTSKKNGSEHSVSCPYGSRRGV